jgi:hypothetical protein
MPRRPVSPVLLLLSAAAAHAQALPPTLPPEVTSAGPEVSRETAELFALCEQGGGTPSIGEGYIRGFESNGDGVEDYVIDLAGFACEGGPGYFCRDSGCPVMVWLSGEDGHSRVWGGYAETVRIEGAAVIVGQSGAACEPPSEPACERRLVLAGAEAPAEGEASQAPGAAENSPVDEPLPRPADGSPAVSDRPVGSWTLRAVPDGDPVAVSAGPGRIETVAAFCLGGEPWLALTLSPPPEAEAVPAGFEFSARTLEVEARREEGAGGAYVVELAGGELAALLAGRDNSVAVTIDGAPQGVLSLEGSSRATRGALAPCGGP